MNTFNGLGLAAMLFLGASKAQAEDPVVVPPDHSFHGMTYAQWSREMLQWRAGIPRDTSPDDAHQSGAVWFLLSSFGATLARTPVTVPSDKFLLFPIISSTWVDTGRLPDLTLKRQRFAVESDIDDFLSVGTLWCEIDGVAVSDLESYRVSTAPGEAFFVTLPDDSIFPGLPAGRYGPTLNAGIYLMLRPLSAGEHTIQIFTSDNSTFTSDVTYELTVE